VLLPPLYQQWCINPLIFENQKILHHIIVDKVDFLTDFCYFYGTD